MNNFEKEPQKVYFTAKEASQIVDENVSCLRFWAAQMGMKLNRGVRNNIRYTVKQVNELTELKNLVRVHRYTVEGAMNFMKKSAIKSQEIDREEKEIMQAAPTKSYHYGK